jgi:hypothetical protein
MRRTTDPRVSFARIPAAASARTARAPTGSRYSTAIMSPTRGRPRFRVRPGRRRAPGGDRPCPHLAGSRATISSVTFQSLAASAGSSASGRHGATLQSAM